MGNLRVAHNVHLSDVRQTKPSPKGHIGGNYIMKTVRVGVMPGRINEFAVEETQSVQEILAIAELDASGYEVKVDGNKVTDLNQPVGDANLILLTKMIKGNGLVRVGVMPGRINEYAVEETQTVQEVLELAELDPSGYEVKADGNKVTDLNQPVGTASLILLTKMIKGNGLVRIGVMPGRINEYALEESTTFRQALETAELDASGYEVKADGAKVTDLDNTIGSTSLILLTKMIKGNN
jgi:sulfur carrier protein ThiS